MAAVASDRLVHQRRLRGARPAALAELALAAARTSYAPYSRDRSGVALSARYPNGTLATFSGGIIESVAYNPTLPPLQVALAAMLAGGLRDWGRIEAAVLAEPPLPRLTSYAPTTVDTLQSIAPGARLSVVHTHTHTT